MSATSTEAGAILPAPAGEMPELARTVEALLFLSADPLAISELAEATEAGEGAVRAALALLAEQYAPGLRGIALRELAGGWTLASDPAHEEAARRLFSRPRIATLTPAQAETLAIVAYLQPISRPEIARIRGVSADSATATLLDRGLIEEAGHSEFGAVLYRTTHPVPEALRPAEPRGAARRGPLGPEPRGAGGAARTGLLRPARRGRARSRRARQAATRAASCPQAASMSRPRVSRTVTGTPRDSRAARKAAIDSRLDPRNSEPLGLKGIRLTLNIGLARSPLAL